jgi:hypothetical protein
VLRFVADDVELSGVLRWRQSDVWLLDVDLSSIRRVTPGHAAPPSFSPLQGTGPQR